MKTAQLANQPRINFSAGKNIRGEVVGSILTLTIDLPEQERAQYTCCDDSRQFCAPRWRHKSGNQCISLD